MRWLLGCSRFALHSALVLVLTFGAARSTGNPAKEVAVRYTCTDVTIRVDHTKPSGVDAHHKSIYLCKDYTVTWTPETNVSSFTVAFDDYPFGGTPTTFDQRPGHQTSPKMPDIADLTVFKYKITVVDKNGISHTFDPHVVGGGGIVIDDAQNVK